MSVVSIEIKTDISKVEDLVRRIEKRIGGSSIRA